MAKKGKIADPHAAREAARYDNPIPSREVILDLLHEAESPLDQEGIATRLSLHEPEDLDALRKRLRAMERDGQLMVNRRGSYGLVDKMNLLHCRVQGHRDGYGFAVPLAGGGEDVYLSARQMNFVFDGDEVLVRVTGVDRRGRQEGKVVEVLVRAHQSIVGRYQEESGIGYVIPENSRINHQILIPPKEKGKAVSGQIVTADITDFPTRQFGAKGRITEILGDHMDPGLEIDVAIRSHGIPWEWPEAVVDEAGRLEAEPLEEDKQNRVDLRKLPFVTIDGEVFHGELNPEAPRTVAAFMKLLPYRQKLIHVRWSGEGVWVPLGDFQLGVGFENHTSHPSVGDILFYPGGYSETEIILAYGACSFASKMGPLAGNHFLTIVEGREHLRALGTTVLWQGAQDVLFEVL